MESKNLSELLTDIVPALDVPDIAITGVAYRSDSVRPGDVFFCIPGFRADGHDYARDAVERGASCVVVERMLDLPVPQVLVSDTRSALAAAAARFHGQPSGRMRVVGITGTNGKTTTSYLLDSILRHAGMTTGLIGTVETRMAGERLGSERTTPESADLQALFARMLGAGVGAVSMEVSSHAIDLHRVDATDFAVAAFTNLSQDHLDYHHTIEEYYSVKKRLFTDLQPAASVVNVDDPYGAVLASCLDSPVTVGRSPQADVRAEDEVHTQSSSRFTLVTPAGGRTVVLPLLGDYNVSNALVAAGCAIALGIEPDVVAEGLESAPQVPGRLERVDAGQSFTVLVDYAHTPDGVAKACAAARAITEGRLITVFGCGGDRDPEKRPLMGAAAGKGSDHVVVTSDNPRSEDPVGIILQIEDGLRPTCVPFDSVVDRRRAIATAFAKARPGDTVLIAGKGHEDYQIFAENTIHFDDREVAREELTKLC